METIKNKKLNQLHQIYFQIYLLTMQKLQMEVDYSQTLQIACFQITQVDCFQNQLVAYFHPMETLISQKQVDFLQVMAHKKNLFLIFKVLVYHQLKIQALHYLEDLLALLKEMNKMILATAHNLKLLKI